MNKPECKYGYPETQLQEELGDVKFHKFLLWMRGQTFSSCTGEEYEHELGKYVPTNCGPHGYVYYTGDVMNFLRGGRVVD